MRSTLIYVSFLSGRLVPTPVIKNHFRRGNNGVKYLDFDDFRLYDGKVKGKGDKERMVPLNRESYQVKILGLHETKGPEG